MPGLFKTKAKAADFAVFEIGVTLHKALAFAFVELRSGEARSRMRLVFFLFVVVLVTQVV